MKKYIKENGGQTTAGPGTLKLKYIELHRGEAAAKAWKEAQKQNKGNTKGKAPNDADAEDSQAEEQPGGELSQCGTADYSLPEDLHWNHDEYAQYHVEGEEGADFGNDVDDEKEGEEEDEDLVWDNDEYDSDFE